MALIHILAVVVIGQLLITQRNGTSGFIYSASNMAAMKKSEL
jgi:hypothetical protein